MLDCGCLSIKLHRNTRGWDHLHNTAGCTFLCLNTFLVSGSYHVHAQTQSHVQTDTQTVNPLTDTPQALLVKAPDEVSTQVTPRGLSVAAGLEAVSLPRLLWELGVLGAAQDSNDAHAAQEVRDLSGADPQGVRPLQTWRRAR